jgi:hypothetical protein
MTLEMLAINPGYRVWGRAAVFTDRTEQHTDCTVIVDHNLERWGELASVGSMQAVISVRRNEISERPRRGEFFTVAGKVYTVELILRSSEHEHEILTVEDQR